MSPLTLLLQQFANHPIETFVDLIAYEVGKLGDEVESTWQTVWSFLGEHHGPETRDQVFAHAVSRGHIHRPTT